MIPPDQCLRRRCRICTREMSLGYCYIDEQRVYGFYCTGCGTSVSIFENISPRLRSGLKLVGCVLEPLTGDEEEQRGFYGQSWKGVCRL